MRLRRDSSQRWRHESQRNVTMTRPAGADSTLQGMAPGDWHAGQDGVSVGGRIGSAGERLNILCLNWSREVQGLCLDASRSRQRVATRGPAAVSKSR